MSMLKALETIAKYQKRVNNALTREKYPAFGGNLVLEMLNDIGNALFSNDKKFARKWKIKSIVEDIQEHLKTSVVSTEFLSEKLNEILKELE